MSQSLIFDNQSFELNYTSKKLNKKYFPKDDSKLEKNRAKKKNQADSLPSDTIELRIDNGDSLFTDLVEGRADISFKYDVNGLSPHNDGSKLVKCVLRVENFSYQKINSHDEAQTRCWFKKTAIPNPLVKSDGLGKNIEMGNTWIFKNCLFRVKHQNAIKKESDCGARTILEIFSHD
tara:strand:- start:508 stop:1038 length:531 start_codon:yes stop_codon:yes gene_type:complete